MLPLITLPPPQNKGDRIAFLGPMCVGKTYCAEILDEWYGHIRYSLAWKLKLIAKELFGVVGKDGQDRILLQELGTEMRRFDKDVWLKYLLSSIETDYPAVIDDVRYENEVNVLKENGFIVVRLTASPETLGGRVHRLYPDRPAASVLHASETEQFGIPVDYELVSENSSDTRLQLSNLMSKLHD